MSRAGLNRRTTLATTTLVLASEAADIDIVWLAKGPVYYFGHHRGITHTFIGAPFVAALTLGFVYLLWRVACRFAGPRTAGCAAGPPGSRDRRPAPRWAVLYLYALLSCLVHILLDYTNSYGVRPFMPFSYRWYSWDIVSIVEPLIWAALIAGLVLPALFRLINEEIGSRSKAPRGRAGAVAALAAVVLLWGVRDYEHRRATAAMNAVVYQGEEPKRVSAFPYAVNPFTWHGVAETEDLFEMSAVDSPNAEIDPQGNARVRYKPDESPASLAAKRTYLGRVYLDWAQYPMTEVEQRHDGSYEVRFYDLRYDYPERGRPLRASVILDKELNEVEERFANRVQKVK